MITTIAKSLNAVVQIAARAFAFVLAILLIVPCWIIVKVAQLLTTILWWIAWFPSWLTGHLMMFAMDLDPAECKKEFQAREDMAQLKKVIQDALREEKQQMDEGEENDDTR